MMLETQDRDHELVDRVLAGEREAFAHLLRRHQRTVLNFMYRMVGQGGAAEDLTQEVFLKAYVSLPRFRKEAAFSTWLFRIAHNHCLNALKGRGREISGSFHTQDPSNPDRFASVPDPSLSASEQLEQRELQTVIQEKLNELTPEHRAVVVLRDIQGLSYDEIASTLDIEGGTVRSRLHRARMELKEKLRTYLET
jgi:RNA polymerase sigma-70 factor, ECF subfamily